MWEQLSIIQLSLTVLWKGPKSAELATGQVDHGIFQFATYDVLGQIDGLVLNA